MSDLSIRHSQSQSAQGPNKAGKTDRVQDKADKKPASSRSKESIQIYHNDAFKPSIKENEQITKHDRNSPEQALIKMIDGARNTLDGAFYDVNSPNIVDALIRAKNRGVEIRLVTDSDNMVDHDAKQKPIKGQTREQIKRLQAAGIPIVEDKRSGLMHNKFMVADHKAVWMGSTNLTNGSLYHHNNDAVVFNSKEMAANYTAEFERLNASKFSKVAKDIPYPEVDINGIKVKPFFSPNGNGLSQVLEELRGAKKSVKFLAFSLSDKEIGAILVDKHRQGLQIEGILDARLAAHPASLFNTLKEAGIPVMRDGNEALLHHKLIIVDDKTVITGSYNFSQAAEKSNNENFVIMKNAGAQAQQYLTIYDKTVHAAKTNRPPRPQQPAPNGGNKPLQPQPNQLPVQQPAQQQPSLFGGSKPAGQKPIKF